MKHETTPLQKLFSALELQTHGWVLSLTHLNYTTVLNVEFYCLKNKTQFRNTMNKFKMKQESNMHLINIKEKISFLPQKKG